MADQSSRNLQALEREVNKAEEARLEAIQRQQQQQKQQQSRKLTKREFCLIVVIVLLTLVICGLVGFIIGWFLWPHSTSAFTASSENDGVNRNNPVDIDDVRIVNESTDADNAGVERFNNESICLTRGCLQAGLQLLEKIDLTADPCRNFWRFACGKTEARNAIFPLKSPTNPIVVLENVVNENVLKLLQSKVGRIGKRSSERKVKQLFAGCMDAEAIEKQGRKEFVETVRILGGWPAIGLWSKEKVRDWKLSEPLKQLQLTFNTDVLFTWKLIPDFDNPEKYMIQLSEGGLTLPDRKFYLENYTSPVLTAYRNFLKSSVVVLGAAAKPAGRFLQDVFNFEKKLAKIYPAESAKVDRKTYNKTTIRSLIALSPEVDWRSFLRSFPNTTSSTEVLLTNPKYFSNLSRLLSTSYPRILQNYLMWRLLYKVMPFMSYKLRDAKAEMTMKVTGRSEKTQRTDDCLHLINNYMGLAVGTLYIRSATQRENKKFVQHMAETIKDTFVTSVDSIRWMDIDTKAKALEKASTLGVEVGYPDYLRVTPAIDNFYSDFSIQQNQTFFKMLSNVLRFSVQKRLEKASRPVDKTQFSWDGVNVHTVRSTYNPRTNVIVLPGGLLQKPVFHRSLPDAINFGTLGTVMAREMVASLIREGSNFDAEGEWNPWWTNDTSLAFQSEVECMSGVFDNSRHGNGAPEDNPRVILEDIADIGGLLLAYKAWETTNNNANKIPGANLTPQQGFFVSFVQGRCETSPSSSLFNALKQPSIFGFEEFTDTFQCLPGPPITPGEECSVL